MKSTNHRRWVLGSVLLACTFLACSTDRRLSRNFADAMVDVGTALRDASSEDAAAQDPQSCMRWEARVVITPRVNRTRFEIIESPDALPSEYDYGTVSIEPGWEPYAANENAIHIRRCVSP